ncbi:MAG: cation diffusion facilitator family transporter [Verrucomicrobiota bacterium JB022]|nr:cation diffusion facilitator family transporter [Verrucomicrobiota bacterium JB022]
MTAPTSDFDHRNLLKVGGIVLAMNILLMCVKIAVGIWGNSYALIADGIESASDIFVSLLTWGGFFLSLRPPDAKHPFGHGKIESVMGVLSGVALLGAAVAIAAFSIREIRTPHHAPEWFTLPVLLMVVVVKELMANRIMKLTTGEMESRALEGDAWHHRSDALTSGAAAIGIAVALIGGEGWAMADDWAALFACLIIAANGFRIVKLSMHDVLDGRVDNELVAALRRTAEADAQVQQVEKCRVRKSGVGYFVELHLQVDAEMTVQAGHELGHQVKARLQKEFPRLIDVVVHLEPHHAAAVQ